MAVRYQHPLALDYKNYCDLQDDLIETIRLCTLTHDECLVVVAFLADSNTHAWLYKTRPLSSVTGMQLVITALPGYIQLMTAARAGASELIPLIYRQIARHQRTRRAA